MIIQHSMVTCIILQGSMTVLLVQNDESSYHGLAYDIIMQKTYVPTFFIVFLFYSKSAEQIDLLENVFALSKGANYKNDKTFVSTTNNTYSYTSNLQSH